MSLFSGDRDGSIICAVSTPPGIGGISAIRVSGPGAYQLVKKSSPQLPIKPVTHTAYLSVFNDKEGLPVDQSLFLYFEKGKSFTGEETVEIFCHGSPIICERILQELILNGAQAALAGEFTYRAFMNGKVDLTQAEAVLGLIESRSKKSAEISLRQLMGGISQKVATIEGNLTWCLAHIEASIDFSTEGLETVEQKTLIQKLKQCLLETEELVATYQKGKLIRDGVQIAIVGRPNVGKSSLLNLLMGYDRSIVTEIEGTTRDVVSDELIFEGQRLCFLDTAGVRKATQDRVEQIGIQKTFETAEKADLVLLVVDAHAGLGKEEIELAQKLKNKRVLVIGNKADLFKETQKLQETLKIVQENPTFRDLEVLFGSTFDKEYRTAILKTILKSVVGELNVGSESLLSSSRHYEGLSRAAKKISDSISSLEKGTGAEFVSLDLKEALIGLQGILGKYFDDQIMDRVFKEFCIGK